MDTLAPKFHVLAADSYGAGKSPSWPTDWTVSLRDEVDLLEPVFARASKPFSLVAHSYGAAVALVAALDRPARVHSLVLYEPTLFALIDAEFPPPNEADGIRAVVADGAAALATGKPAEAAKRFIDFWMGSGAWDRMPEQRKLPIVSSITNVSGWASALLNEPTPLQAFSKLSLPVLYMIGKDSPASSRGVARLLTGALPRVEVIDFEGLGHMGPVTHPDIVNTAISRFLDGQSQQSARPGA